ncbi:methyltransferase domain-containing protein [Ruegeria lacuscaerulensis]|uniref:methyltransferase domain-containing protein n=1 Tax=Ruegeria lacuscaerulensis TaxID=55218 RepID=UPI00147D7BA0|nr:methyltransferase domain-containing protein [Ruegeria lacuscaerulensis]
MSHIYSNEFFDYIDHGARQSANSLIRCVQSWIAPQSVVDFGCGRGVWLSEWAAAGCKDIAGVDGNYVDRERLAISRDAFFGHDLIQPVDLGQRFDLAQSLEVGEHLPNEASASLVQSLTTHADMILFSAAVPGQGGEFHINEQPLSFWQGLFADRGYSAYDCLRPVLFSDTSIEPWYRYNTVLYANESGAKILPPDVLKTKVADGALKEVGTFGWNLRKTIVRRLPRATVTAIAQARASIIARSYGGKE